MILRLICVILFVTSWTHATANERIAAIGPEIVEITFALGAGDQIIAVDKHSTYPPETKAKINLGYFRALAAEGIISTKPDLVIVTPDAGPPETLEILKGSDLDVRIAPDANSPTEVPQLIKFIGKVIGKEAEAQSLIENYQSQLSLSERFEVNDTKAIFLIAIQSGTPIAAGKDTVPNALIEFAGATNVASFSGFKPITTETMIQYNPDVIIMMPERIEATGGLTAVSAIPGIAATRAGMERNILTMDAGLILRLGPRTATTVAELKQYFLNLK